MEIKHMGGYLFRVLFVCFLKRGRKNLFWNKQKQVTLCSSGNVDLTQLRQPSEELLGFWQTHKFKARQGQTFIYYYHNIFTEILKIFVKKLIMKCAFIWHLSLFWLNKCWWFSFLRSWHFFYMVSIEIPLPEPRIKMRGGKIIPYILCELVSIIWMLPAFEFHCWTRLLLCQCSSISREMAVPIGSLSCGGSPACGHPRSAGHRDNQRSLLCATTAGAQTRYRQEEELQTWRSKTLVLWGSPPQCSVGTGTCFLCLWDSVSQPIKQETYPEHIQNSCSSFFSLSYSLTSAKTCIWHGNGPSSAEGGGKQADLNQGQQF